MRKKKKLGKENGLLKEFQLLGQLCFLDLRALNTSVGIMHMKLFWILIFDLSEYTFASVNLPEDQFKSKTKSRFEGCISYVTSYSTLKKTHFHILTARFSRECRFDILRYLDRKFIKFLWKEGMSFVYSF